MKIPSAGSPIFLQAANTEDKEKAALLSQIFQTSAAINTERKLSIVFLQYLISRKTYF